MTRVECGENIRVKVKGVEEADISPGFVLCDPNNPIKSGKVFDAQASFTFFNRPRSRLEPSLHLRLSFWTTRASSVLEKLLSCTYKPSSKKSLLKPSFVW